MQQSYEDIRRRIGVPPLWHDENSVPRYDPFEPRLCANIYCDECALVVIACQNCGEYFKVAFSESVLSRVSIENADIRATLADQIKAGSIHFGDPPRRDCCPGGPTMNCLDLMVIEYWRLDDMHQWERLRELEIPLPDSPDYHASASKQG